jgi:hypothetical protein
VLEEEHAALTHHLPEDFEGGFVFASVIATGCRLVEVAPSSRNKKRKFLDLLLKQSQFDLPLLGFCIA